MAHALFPTMSAMIEKVLRNTDITVKMSESELGDIAKAASIERAKNTRGLELVQGKDPSKADYKINFHEYMQGMTENLVKLADALAPIAEKQGLPKPMTISKSRGGKYDIELNVPALLTMVHNNSISDVLKTNAELRDDYPELLQSLTKLVNTLTTRVASNFDMSMVNGPEFTTQLAGLVNELGTLGKPVGVSNVKTNNGNISLTFDANRAADVYRHFVLQSQKALNDPAVKSMMTEWDKSYGQLFPSPMMSMEDVLTSVTNVRPAGRHGISATLDWNKIGKSYVAMLQESGLDQAPGVTLKQEGQDTVLNIRFKDDKGQDVGHLQPFARGIADAVMGRLLPKAVDKVHETLAKTASLATPGLMMAR